MPLAECMERVTHREYLLWQAHFEDDDNRPTITHYYLAQIAQEVRRVLATNKGKIKLKYFLISFGRKKTADETAADNKLALAQIKAGAAENQRRRENLRGQPDE